MSWFVDVTDTSGNRLGSGPLATAASWESTARMDRAGAFSCVIAATDAQADVVAPGVILRCTATVNGAYTEIGAGLVERIETAIDEEGRATLTISGQDLVGGLGLLHMGRQSFVSGSSPITHAAAVALLETAAADAPGGAWTFTAAGAPGVDEIYAAWNYDSVLAACIAVAGRSYVHFYQSGSQALTFAESFTASGLRAVRPGTAGTGVCAIAALQVVEDAADLCNDLTPFGSGNSAAMLNINATTRTAPSGIAQETTSYGDDKLTAAASIATYGRRQRALQWKDITPISSTDADVQAAANVLFDEAVRYLQLYSEPAEFYALAVAEAPALLRPMQTIRLTWRDTAQGVAIDDDLYILEATTRVDAEGPRTTALTVSTAERWPVSDTGAIVTKLAQGTVYQAHPQLNANSYVISYTKPVDDVETASFRFRFDAEVVQLTRVTFDFQLLPLESTVRAVGGATSGSGDLSTDGPSTNTSGNPSNNTSGTPSTNTSGAATGNTGAAAGSTGTPSTDTSGAATGNTGAATGNTGAATGNTGAATGNTGGSGTLTTDGPQGGDIISGGRHQHTIGITLGATVTYPIGYSAAGTAGGLVSSAPGGTHNYPTNESGNHDHDVDSHSHTLNSHTHDLGSHTHDLGSHTHTLSNHTHDLGSHTHTLNSHTHDLGNHTHTLNNHTHDLSESITAIYGIFRDTAGNTFGLTDLEYSVDGATWYAFSVGVNGFASLGDGWYRVDLTALLQNSTTLRPLAGNNAVQVRRKSTGAIKKAMIEAQLNVRTIIQAIAAL